MTDKQCYWAVWYLDVWGNQEDGWEVNNRRRVGTLGLLPQDASPTAIYYAMKGNLHLGSNCEPRDIRIETDDDTFISIDDAETGEPLYQLTWESPCEAT